MASGRAQTSELLIGVGLYAAALALRAWLASRALGGEPVVLGVDADDWALATRALAEGAPELIQGNRYPLLPWLAALAVGHLGAAPARALLWIALPIGALGPALTWLIGRLYLGRPWALAAALWVTLGGTATACGASTTAYAVFAPAFLLCVGAALGGFGRAAPAAAALGALAAVATLWQGLLSVLVALPAALILRRWSVAAAGTSGAAAGALLVERLHPASLSPLGTMLQELGINIEVNPAVQQELILPHARDAFQSWTLSSFGLQPRGFWALVALACFGVLALALPALRLGPRLALRGVSRRERAARPAAAAALGWCLLPLLQLFSILDSAHHFEHLMPLLAIAAAAGVAALVPPAAGWPLVAAWGLWLGAREPGRAARTLRDWGVQSRAERAAALALADMVGGRGDIGVAMIDRQPDQLAWRAWWALPPGVRLIAIWPSQQRRATDCQALDAVTTSGEEREWAVGTCRYVAVGEPLELALEGTPMRALAWRVERR